MKSKILILPLSFLMITLLSSCSHRIVGDWSVKRYETKIPGNQSVSLSNIGTIHFRSNGSGDKNLNYNVLGIQRNDEIPFNWSWDEGKYITIDSEGSDLSKTWIIIENKNNFQRWKSTDGIDNVQTIELKKQ